MLGGRGYYYIWRIFLVYEVGLEIRAQRKFDIALVVWKICILNTLGAS